MCCVFNDAANVSNISLNNFKMYSNKFLNRLTDNINGSNFKS